MRVRLLTFAIAFLLLTGTLQLFGQATHPAAGVSIVSNAEIRQLLVDRINAIAGPKDGIGIVVGVVEPTGRRVIAYGRQEKTNARPIDGDTCFEIGSVTKVFSALLLAEMVQTGEVLLADPVAKFLAPGVKVPTRGRPITLEDLATHTSALPFMPDDDVMVPTSVKPSSSFYQFLARYQLPRDPGTEWEYSNLGYWLLGEALANRAGMSYETALQTRVLAPLRLANTAFIPSPRMKDKLAVGHDAALQRAPAWNQLSMYADLQAAGGLISTTNDLLTFLAATLGYDKSPLSPAMAAMLTVRRPISGPDVAQALGWVVAGKGDEQLIVHEGGTWGYASSVAWDPKARIGVVVLSNQLTSVDDIARHLLRPNIPLAKVVSAVHSEIALTSTTLDSYIGRYEGLDGETFIVGREGDYLKIKLPSDWGLPNLRVRPETHTRFFVSELPLRLEFETDANGQVAGMLVYPPRGQRALHTTRVSSSK